MRSFPSFAAAAPVLVLLASCVAPPQQSAQPAPPQPLPAPAPEPAPAPASMEWHDRPVAAGNWVYGPEAGGTAARYGSSPAAPLLILRCDPATRRISVTRPGAAQGSMTIRTSYGAMAWPASGVSGAAPQTVATRAASDPALDQIAYSRGKFAVEVTGLAPLILPNWAEISRVIEDCRG